MKKLVLIALAVLWSSSISVAWAAPTFEILRLGFDDLEHTDNSGARYSYPYTLNEAGQVIGHSQRYDGGNENRGQSVWLYDGTKTINVGLVGPEYTSVDGFKYSAVTALSEAGRAIGHSARGVDASAWLYDGQATFEIGLTGSDLNIYDGYHHNIPVGLNEMGQVMGHTEYYNGGSSDLGQSAWLYDGTKTVEIGLTGPEHTRSDGVRLNQTMNLNQAGHVMGRAKRFNENSIESEFSAWLYDGTTTVDIGLSGREYTNIVGSKHSEPLALNEAGQVVGYSRLYNTFDVLGQTTWLYVGGATIDVGPSGHQYTRAGGYKFSRPLALNEAGQVVGTAFRYDGHELRGENAWLYDGTTTIDIGLTDSEHTSLNGSQSSYSYLLNESGQAAGLTARFNGGRESLGQSAWLYDGTTTKNIGLTGPEHTRSDGFRFSALKTLNEAGQVIGNADRYDDFLNGSTAWLYNGTTTIDVGLAGAEHTRNDGYKVSFVEQLSEMGHVTGHSFRYNGGEEQLGRDAWFYDSVLNQAFSLQLSVRSDGYAFSAVHYLGADGLALGTYELFDSQSGSLGSRAFYFTVADGLHDLGPLVDSGLVANGWDSLANTVRSNGLGQIVGVGKLASPSGGQMAYLLTPVPEPNVVCLASLLSASLLLLRSRL